MVTHVAVVQAVVLSNYGLYRANKSSMLFYRLTKLSRKFGHRLPKERKTKAAAAGIDPFVKCPRINVLLATGHLSGL